MGTRTANSCVSTRSVALCATVGRATCSVPTRGPVTTSTNASSTMADAVSCAETKRREEDASALGDTFWLKTESLASVSNTAS